MGEPAAWKRTFTLETLPEKWKTRLRDLMALAEPERGDGRYLRTPAAGSSLSDARKDFLEVLNYGPSATKARDVVSARYPGAALTPEAQATRLDLILDERLHEAWRHVEVLYADTVERLNELERRGELDSGAELFREVLARIRAHYYLEEEWHYTICALFVMQAWVVRAGSLPAVFYLYFAGTMSSGKSNILHLISQLTDGLMLENVSPSALARIISSDGEGRALLLDEIDVERGQELDDVMAALLRSGYRRNGPPYVRWNAKEKRSESFPVFGPKAGSYRSALDPALQSRGFVIPTAKPIGEDYYGLVLANLWPRTADLVPRLREWGKAAALRWPAEALEELAKSAEFQADLRRVTGAIGANRESELVTIALLVARMVPVDAAASLQNAAELRNVEMSEDQAEAIEELRSAALTNLSKTVSFAPDGREVFRVFQKSVRDEVNRRRKERQERPLTPGRLALLRREWGVKDAWLSEKGHRLVWNLPRVFVDSVQTPPAGTPPHLPTSPRTPPGEVGGSTNVSDPPVERSDVKNGSSGEQGSTGGVPGEGYTSGDVLSDNLNQLSDTGQTSPDYQGSTTKPSPDPFPGPVLEERDNWTVPTPARDPRSLDHPGPGDVFSGPKRPRHSNCRACSSQAVHVCYACPTCKWQETHGGDR